MNQRSSFLTGITMIAVLALAPAPAFSQATSTGEARGSKTGAAEAAVAKPVAPKPRAPCGRRRS